MKLLLWAAVVSLLLPLKLKTLGVTLRPFDLLVLAAFGLSLLQAHVRKDLNVPAALLPLIGFFALQTLSAYWGLGTGNLVREGLQSILVVAFALTLSRVADGIDYTRLYKTLVIAIALITLYTAIWHLQESVIYSWKRLNETKAVFILIPLFAGMGLILRRSATINPTLVVTWMAIAPLLYFAAERKATLAYLFLTAVIFLKGRIGVIGLSLASIIVTLSALSWMTGDTDDSQILGYYTRLTDVSAHYTLDQIAAGRQLTHDVISREQRLFSFKIGLEQLAEAPLTGVGTNVYETLVDKHYAWVPEALRIGIHNEFFRVLVENGPVGLALYLMVWLFSYRGTRRVLREAHRQGMIFAFQRSALPPVIYAPLFISTFFEASGIHAHAVLVIVALTPKMLAYALNQRHARRTAMSTGYDSATPSREARSSPDGHSVPHPSHPSA